MYISCIYILNKSNNVSVNFYSIFVFILFIISPTHFLANNKNDPNVSDNLLKNQKFTLFSTVNLMKLFHKHFNSCLKHEESH